MLYVLSAQCDEDTQTLACSEQCLCCWLHFLFDN